MSDPLFRGVQHGSVGRLGGVDASNEQVVMQKISAQIERVIALAQAVGDACADVGAAARALAQARAARPKPPTGEVSEEAARAYADDVKAWEADVASKEADLSRAHDALARAVDELRAGERELGRLYNMELPTARRNDEDIRRRMQEAANAASRAEGQARQTLEDYPRPDAREKVVNVNREAQRKALQGQSNTAVNVNRLGINFD